MRTGSAVANPGLQNLICQTLFPRILICISVKSERNYYRPRGFIRATTFSAAASPCGFGGGAFAFISFLLRLDESQLVSIGVFDRHDPESKIVVRRIVTPRLAPASSSAPGVSVYVHGGANGAKGRTDFLGPPLESARHPQSTSPQCR